MPNSKPDQIIWWLMITFASVIIVGGGAWANSISNKVEKIISIETDISYIKNDVNELKKIIIREIKKNEEF